jgi:hypothetical protein
VQNRDPLKGEGFTIVHTHWLFAWNVLSHLVASMSGIASFMFSMWEHVRGKKIESRAFFIVGVLCLMIAFDQAWQDEHNNIKVLIGEKSSLWQERDFWKNQSYDKDASLRTRDELLTKNYNVLADNLSSLTALSNRLADVAKPEPLKIDVMRWSLSTTFAATNVAKVRFWVLVLISNKTIFPTRGTITCDAPFTPMTSTILTHGNVMRMDYWQPDPKSIHVEFSYPPWSAKNPLVVAVYTPMTKDIQNCSYKPD